MGGRTGLLRVQYMYLEVTGCSHHRIPLLPNPGLLTVAPSTFTHSRQELEGVKSFSNFLPPVAVTPL